MNFLGRLLIMPLIIGKPSAKEQTGPVILTRSDWLAALIQAQDAVGGQASDWGGGEGGTARGAGEV